MRPARRGGPAGDLYVVIFVQDDARFTRDGNDLLHQADVPFTTLALGGDVVVPGIDGTSRGEGAGRHRHRYDVPRAWQGHARRVGPRQGRPARDGARHDAPTRLTRDQRRLLEELAATLPPTHAADEDKGLFGKVKDIFG